VEGLVERQQLHAAGPADRLSGVSNGGALELAAIVESMVQLPLDGPVWNSVFTVAPLSAMPPYLLPFVESSVARSYPLTRPGAPCP